MELKQFLPNITEPEYRLLDKVNYSFLKNLVEKGPRAIIEPSPEIFGDGLTLGTIVDKRLSDASYITESEYMISDTQLDLSGDNHLSKILVFLRGNKDVLLIRDDIDTFNRICSILEFKRFPTPTDDFWKQVELMNITNSGQKVLSSSEYMLSNTMVNTFLTHPYTFPIFNVDLGVEVLNQVVIVTTIKGVGVKILVDKIIINHKIRKILLFDIKTGASSDFMKNFFGYKYYYQGALYYQAVVTFLQSIPEFAEYEVWSGFNFIYVSRDNPNVPFIYNMKLDYINLVLEGFETVNGAKIKGIYELLDDYSWYKQNEIYDTTKEIYENKGVVEIKTPNIWKSVK